MSPQPALLAKGLPAACGCSVPPWPSGYVDALANRKSELPEYWQLSIHRSPLYAKATPPVKPGMLPKSVCVNPSCREVKGCAWARGIRLAHKKLNRQRRDKSVLVMSSCFTIKLPLSPESSISRLSGRTPRGRPPAICEIRA